MNDHLAFTFRLPPERQELLLAELSLLPFNGFVESDDELLAYLAAEDDSPTLRAHLTHLARHHQAALSVMTIPYQNWNETWEAAFEPVRVGDFVGVRATFHPPFQGVVHDLLIEPRMAFGTGHHATTYLMLERMGEMNWHDRRVFDYGCGTGVLAILAAKLGAGPIVANDIEHEAYTNTLDNMAVNGVAGIEVREGGLDIVPEEGFSAILANINRNVILASLPALYDKLEAGGDCLVSGILADDETRVVAAAREAGFSLTLQRRRDNWLLLHLRKPPLAE